MAHLRVDTFVTGFLLSWTLGFGSGFVGNCCSGGTIFEDVIILYTGTTLLNRSKASETNFILSLSLAFATFLLYLLMVWCLELLEDLLAGLVLLLASIWFFSVASLLAMDLARRLLDLEGNEFTSSEIIFGYFLVPIGTFCKLTEKLTRRRFNTSYQVGGLEPTERPIQQVFV